MKYTKAFLERRLELLALDTGWNVQGPVWVDGKAIVGRVFLQKAPVGNRWRIVEMATAGGGEFNHTDTLSPAELVEWTGGAMWAFQEMKRRAAL